MPYGAYNGYLALIYGLCDYLLVEGPKILHTAATAAHYQHIRLPYAVHFVYRVGDLRCRPLTLNPYRVQQYIHAIKAAARYIDYILHRSSRRRCDHAYTFGQPRYGLLMALIEVAPGIKPCLHQHKAAEKLSFALPLHGCDVKLVLAVLDVKRHASVYPYGLTVLRRKIELIGVLPEHYATHQRPFVLQRKIKMS